MIRSHDVKLPRGIKKWARQIYTNSKHIEAYWLQDSCPEPWRELLIRLCPYTGKKKPDVVVHVITACTNWHRDRMAKSVYVIPLITAKTVKLEVESNYRLYKNHVADMEVGRAYRFNDHQYHGLRNPNHANVVLVTVSFMDD